MDAGSKPEAPAIGRVTLVTDPIPRSIESSSPPCSSHAHRSRISLRPGSGVMVNALTPKLRWWNRISGPSLRSSKQTAVLIPTRRRSTVSSRSSAITLRSTSSIQVALYHIPVLARSHAIVPSTGSRSACTRSPGCPVSASWPHQVPSPTSAHPCHVVERLPPIQR